MSEFIGQLGSLAFFAVCVAILLRFFCEVGVVDRETQARPLLKTGLFAFFVGCAYTFALWFVYNFTHDQKAAFFSLELLWVGPCAEVLALCQSFDWTGCFQAGIMPLHPMLVHLIGSLLFDKFAAVAGCISFLSAGAFLWNMRLVSRRLSLNGNHVVLFLATFPAAFLLFAPHPLALFLALASGAFVALLYEKKALAVVLAAISALTSFFGLAVLLAVVGSLLIAKGKISDGKEMAAATDASKEFDRKGAQADPAAGMRTTKLDWILVIVCGAAFAVFAGLQIGPSWRLVGIFALFAVSIWLAARMHLPRVFLYYLAFVFLVPAVFPQIQGYSLYGLPALFPAVAALAEEKACSGLFVRRGLVFLLFPMLNGLILLTLFHG